VWTESIKENTRGNKKDSMNITRQQLSSFIDDHYIKRGEQIIQDGTVYLDRIYTDHIEAYAVGTGIYCVKLFKSTASHQINGRCTCPAFFDFGPCKHIAATGLARIQADYEPNEWCCEQIDTLKDALHFLRKQSKEQLINIIMDLIAQDQELLEFIQQS
jgi:uncharacterized Zn finger protein